MLTTKKVLGVFVPLKAISSRNLTSMGLVLFFFFVYWASGGKVTAVPKIDRGSGFGSANASAPIRLRGDLEVKPSSNTSSAKTAFTNGVKLQKQNKQSTNQQRGSLFLNNSKSEPEELEQVDQVQEEASGENTDRPKTHLDLLKQRLDRSLER